MLGSLGVRIVKASITRIRIVRVRERHDQGQGAGQGYSSGYLVEALESFAQKSCDCVVDLTLCGFT